MYELMFTQYECLSCRKWFKKSQRRRHEQEFNHDIARKGVVVKPKEAEPETITVKACLRRVKKSPELYARGLYPNTYLLLDTIRGSILKPQR